MRALTVRRLALGLTLAATLTGRAQAGDDVASQFGLGAVPRYSSEDQARAGCGGDSVVWADPKTGFYYPKFAPEYGTSPTGAFTCFKRAKTADYWGFGSLDALASDRGRVFPIIQDPICVWYQDKAGNWKCGKAGL